MQTFLTIAIVVLTILQLFVNGSVVDHGSFSVMIDDSDLSRSRSTSVPAITPISESTTNIPSVSSSPADALNVSAAAPASFTSIQNSSLTNAMNGSAVKNTGDIIASNDSSANSLLAAIRSASEAADLQYKPASTNENPKRGYLSSMSNKPVDKRPSAISIIEENLLVVPMPNGVQAIAYGINAADSYGHEYHNGVKGVKVVPGLRPVLPVNQPSTNSDNWLRFQPNVAGSQSQFSETNDAQYRAQIPSADYDLEFQQHKVPGDDRDTGFQFGQPQMPVGDDGKGFQFGQPQMPVGDDGKGFQFGQPQMPVKDNQKDSQFRGPLKPAGVNQKPQMSTGNDEDELDFPSPATMWVQKPSKQGSAQLEGASLKRNAVQDQTESRPSQGQGELHPWERHQGRHFVHIRDDVFESSQVQNGDGRAPHNHNQGKTRHHNVRNDEDHGEHKKQKRQPIRKYAEEWRCLESDVTAGVQVEKLVCPPGLMITSFGLASLGNPQGACKGQGTRQPGACHFDLSTTLQNQCRGKSVCDIESIRVADVQKHCPGYSGESRAVIEYQCSPWVSKPAESNSTIEHCQKVQNNGTLNCPQDQVILGFGFGFFGEIDGSCSKGISPGVCSRNVMTDLTAKCVGRSQCQVEVNTKQFGSACSNSTSLSLAASFKCGPLSEYVPNNSTQKAINQTYSSSNLQFAKGNGAAKQCFIGASMIAFGIISFLI